MRFFHHLWVFILWLNVDESFQQIEIKCTVPVIDNGHVLEDVKEYRENEILHFVCNNKYKRTEERPSKCVQVGERADWSPTPACEKVVCIRQDPHVSRWYVDYWTNTNKITLGETIGYSCRSGYMKTAAEATCSRDGWEPNPLCREMTCDRLDVQNAVITNNDKMIYKYNERVRYFCSEGFTGQFTLTCGERGWSGNPRCTEITCEPPNQYGDIINYKVQYGYNEQVDLKCRVPYKGSFSLTCGERGWIGQQKCTEIKCNILQHIDLNANLEGTREEYWYNEKVYYACKTGGGSYSLTCGENGWIGTSSCKGKTCKKLDIENADIVRNSKKIYSYDETVEYECSTNKDKRFNVTCDNGEWTDIQSCPEVPGCETPPALLDGDLRDTMKSQYRHNERVEYMCQTYYTMEGEPHRTCINGAWTGYMRCLKPCIVNEVDIRQNNITLTSSDKKYLVHDEVIEFRCASGTPVGTAAMRQRCNSGEIMLPACY